MDYFNCWKVILLWTIVHLHTIAVLSSHETFIQRSDVIETKSGPVQGVITKTVSGEQLVRFLGIPYAEPPIGELRFRPAKEVVPWTSVLHAVKPMPSCYQQLPRSITSIKEVRLTAMRPWSEDCLHLNIWASQNITELVPVVVFIHAGAFVFGSGLWFTDGTLLASSGLVVVTLNYRLGVFGFLYLGNSAAPGNVGLMDQHLALVWVRENIFAFGGNPDRITLMGMSAGSASVGYHLLAPKSRGLFDSAIMMSGAPTNWWANMEPEHGLEMTNSLIATLGCQSPNNTAALRCLIRKHPEDIIDSVKSKSSDLENNFVPTVDGKFIVEHPSVSVAAAKFNPSRVLIGSAIDEAAPYAVSSNPGVFHDKDGHLFRRNFLSVIRKSHPEISNLQAKVLDVMYTDWSNPDDPLLLRDAAKDLYSDSINLCNINEFSDKLVEAGHQVYRYVFDYGIPSPLKPDWVGAAHAEDQVLVLGPEELLKEDGRFKHEINKRFLEHFVNFIKAGDPNLNTEEFPGEPKWPMYNAKRQHLNFAVNSSIRSDSQRQKCAVWLKLIPLLSEKQAC